MISKAQSQRIGWVAAESIIGRMKKTVASETGDQTMRLRRAAIRNFRLLREADLCFDPRSTVIVGRNNSGKTSLTELFRRLLQDEKSPRFRLEDFSLCAYDMFWNAFLLHQQACEEDEVRSALPVVETRLTVAYGDSANLGLLGEFIVDLDPETTEAVILVRYGPKEGAVAYLFEGLSPDPGVPESPSETFFKELAKRISDCYEAVLTAVDPHDETNTKTLEWSKLRALVQVGFINAQRGLDDVTHKDRDVLSKILESLFKTAISNEADSEDRRIAESLELAVASVQESIDGEFREYLKTLSPTFDLFGYPGLTDPQLRTETTLEVERLLTDHTRIRYGSVDGVSLPETYNGLGTRNLIFILLQLLAFFKEYQAKPESPALHMVFIEEPEAHLHPQMQEVFISKLSEIADAFAKGYNEGRPWPVQFIVTTHSPHIANQAPFDATRYFVAIPEPKPPLKPKAKAQAQACAGDSCSTKIKDLGAGPSGMKKQDRDFLHQYMTLTRCDLFFADKAVLIEGATERLMLPVMIKKVEEKQAPGERGLSSQYLSVVEVGGAYAHRFYDLLDFLELRTLIVTDLDSVDKDSKGEACKVSAGVKSSNACVNDWFEKKGQSPAELIKKTEDEKTKPLRRLAYQVPEANDGPCGRSFEAAFMLANEELFNLSGSDVQKEEEVWVKTEKVKKTEFALKYAIDETEWAVPRYIAEGLNWLAEGPSCGMPGATEGATSADDATSAEGSTS